jgi:hypothetical protein
MEKPMRLIERKPEETKKKENVFNGIEKRPWWRWWLEMVAYAAAVLVIAEFLVRHWF